MAEELQVKREIVLEADAQIKRHCVLNGAPFAPEEFPKKK